MVQQKSKKFTAIWNLQKKFFNSADNCFDHWPLRHLVNTHTSEKQKVFKYFQQFFRRNSSTYPNESVSHLLQYTCASSQVALAHHRQTALSPKGPTSTLYLNRTRIFLSYSNPTRKFLKNDRVASSVYFSHFREIAARPASQYYSHMNTALVRSPMSFDHKKSKCIFGSKRNTQ